MSDLGQPFLPFSPDEIEPDFSPAGTGDYTAERVFSRKPEVYHQSAYLLAQGMSYRAVARVMHIHHKIAAAIKEREVTSGNMDTVKRDIGLSFRSLTALALDSIREILVDPAAKHSVRDLAILAGVTADKAELLLGGATHRVEYVPRSSSAEDYIRAMRDVQDAEIGLPSGYVAPKAPGLDAGDNALSLAGNDALLIDNQLSYAEIPHDCAGGGAGGVVLGAGADAGAGAGGVVPGAGGGVEGGERERGGGGRSGSDGPSHIMESPAENFEQMADMADMAEGDDDDA